MERFMYPSDWYEGNKDTLMYLRRRVGLAPAYPSGGWDPGSPMCRRAFWTRVLP